MEDEVRAPAPGQGPRYGGGIRQKVGGVRRHAGGLVDHQQRAVLPYDGQRPVAGSGQDLGLPVVPSLRRHHVSGVEDARGPSVLSIHQNAVFRPGQTGDGVGGEVQLGFQNMADGGAVLLRGDGVRNGFQRLGPLSVFSIAQKLPFA